VSYVCFAQRYNVWEIIGINGDVEWTAGHYGEPFGVPVKVHPTPNPPPEKSLSDIALRSGVSLGLGT